MNIDKRLEALSRIRQVDAPDFLFTRIESQLAGESMPVSNRLKLATALGFAVIILMNILVVNSSAKQNTGIEPLVNSMNLSTQNHLYDE